MVDIKEQIKQDYLTGIMPKALAEKYDTSENTIKSWIKRYGWSKMKGEGAPSKEVQGAPRKHGGQPGNQNAAGHGAPIGNKNATKHGLFSRYLPSDTLEIFNALDDTNPLDFLWDQIKLAYISILRAQQIMYVTDKDDVTTTKIEEKSGDTSWGEKWEVQQAWDKQASFLKAQAKAQSELRNMIKQYDELLHKNWDMATEEQRARIEQMKANTEKLKGVGQDPLEDKVKKLFDTIGGALDAES